MQNNWSPLTKDLCNHILSWLFPSRRGSHFDNASRATRYANLMRLFNSFKRQQLEAFTDTIVDNVEGDSILLKKYCQILSHFTGSR